MLCIYLCVIIITEKWCFIINSNESHIINWENNKMQLSYYYINFLWVKKMRLLYMVWWWCDWWYWAAAPAGFWRMLWQLGCHVHYGHCWLQPCTGQGHPHPEPWHSGSDVRSPQSEQGWWRVKELLSTSWRITTIGPSISECKVTAWSWVMSWQ